MIRLLAMASVVLSCALAAGQQQRPNILWITSEDHGPEMGCYGDSIASTPNVDALAKRGMLFQMAWSCAPVCAPARTAIITGMYPPSIGAQHMRSMVGLPRRVRFFPAFLAEQGYYCVNRGKTDYNVRGQERCWHASSAKAHYKRRKKGQPFFAVFNTTISHESKIRKRPHKQVTDPAKVRVPAYHPDNSDTRRDWAQYYDVVSRADAFAGKCLADLDRAGLSDSTIVFYYGDHGSGMPRSKRWTYNSGLSVPMVVYFPRKWRHLAPKEYEVGGKSDRLVNFVDLAPTVLSLAGIRPPDPMQGHAFAGKFQQAPPQYIFGFRDRMDERYDLIRTVTDGRYQYIRNYNPHLIYGQHVRYNFQTPSTAAWRRDFDEGRCNPAQSSFWGTKPAEELYDLTADPDEVVNLVDSPKHQVKLRELQQAQQDWCRRIRDVGFLPEGEIHSRSRGSNPRDMGLDEKKYPFDRIFAAAERATMVGNDDLPFLLACLKDSDSAVRYWGVMGVLIRGRDAVSKSKPELLAALKDESKFVRIVAAHVLCKHGDAENLRLGLDCLVDLARRRSAGDVFVSLAAVNVLDSLDAKVALVLDAIKALPETGPLPSKRYQGYVGRVLEKMRADLK